MACGVLKCLQVLCLGADEVQWVQVPPWTLILCVTQAALGPGGPAHSLTPGPPKLVLWDLPDMFRSRLHPRDLLQLTYRVCEREPVSLRTEAQLQLLEGCTRPVSPDFL